MLTKTAVSAIRALLIIGQESHEEPISLSALSKAIDDSPTYLSKILGMLTKAGILISERGVHGGVRLAKPPSQITFLDVVEATQGIILADYCTDVSKLEVNTCAFHQAMAELHSNFTHVLAKWTIEHLLSEPAPRTNLELASRCRMAYDHHCFKPHCGTSSKDSTS